MLDLVFIILRYVNSEKVDKYWKESYDCIRKFYPTTKIIIIDDNSPYPPDESYELVNCEIIKSEFPQRGELLPYYYFHKLKPAKKAVIVHDSVFINSPLELDNIDTYKFLWEFDHKWDSDKETAMIILRCKNKTDLIKFYADKTKWKGCFGSMSVITWDFLDKVNTHFNLFNIMIPFITNREARMCFERIFGCMCTCIDKYNRPLFGDIHNWVYLLTNNEKGFFIRKDEYEEKKEYFKKFPIMKVWSDR